MKTIFKVGDRVRYGDFEGVIFDNKIKGYPLRIKGDGWEESFTKEGKLYINHDYPITLTLIESAKVKTVRRFYQWAMKVDNYLYLLTEMLDEEFRGIKGDISDQDPDNTYHKTNTYVDIEVEW